MARCAARSVEQFGVTRDSLRGTQTAFPCAGDRTAVAADGNVTVRLAVGDGEAGLATLGTRQSRLLLGAKQPGSLRGIQ